MKKIHDVEVVWRDGSRTLETVGVEYDRADNLTGWLFGHVNEEVPAGSPVLTLRIDSQPSGNPNAAPPQTGPYSFATGYSFAVDESFALAAHARCRGVSLLPALPSKYGRR